MCPAPIRGIVAAVIEVNELTKRYRDAVAVDELSFSVEPGMVTGFLGPNGAGKTTTMRVLLGLVAPTAGEALIGGRPYTSLPYPLREVGALLDASAVHPGRSAVEHLRWLARTNGISACRVAETLDRVGLTGGEAIDLLTRLRGSVDPQRKKLLLDRFELDPSKKARTYSKGNRQKVALVAAFASDVELYLLDEPTSGLDPLMETVFQDVVRRLRDDGRTVLLSSHLMSEMELTADRLVIIGRGRLLLDTTIGELITTEGFTTLEEAYLALTDESTVHRAGGELP